MAVDNRLILRGYNGKLYHEGEFLSDVPEWSMTLNFNTVDYQAAGEQLVAGIFVGFSQSLAFTQTHITDVLLAKIFEYIKGEIKEGFAFEGELVRPDGERSWYVCRSCEPDGTTQVANVTQGAMLNRE